MIYDFSHPFIIAESENFNFVADEWVSNVGDAAGEAITAVSTRIDGLQARTSTLRSGACLGTGCGRRRRPTFHW